MSDIRRVYVQAWWEPEAEIVNPQEGLIAVVFDEPSGDELLPRLAWMRPEDVIFSPLSIAAAEARGRKQAAAEIAAIVAKYHVSVSESNDGSDPYCHLCGLDYPCPTLQAVRGYAAEQDTRP